MMFYEARECRGCGEAYVALRPNQARCKPGCGRDRADAHVARATKRAEPIEFIGIDGEGVTDPLTGEHRYVLLSCGDKHLSNDGAHLHIDEILPFLWSCFEEHPDACFVGFYLPYDWGQWLRTLPESRARMLLTAEGIAARRRPEGQERLGPYPVWHGSWDIDYLVGRRWKLRPGGKPRVKGPWMWICDAGPFFQMSFLNAIDRTKTPDPVVTEAEFELIKEGKRRRSSAEFDPNMVTYNQLECEVLARLMRQHDEGLRSIGLKKLNRREWFGPGQAAEKWLKMVGAPTGKEVREAVPQAVRDAARASYFGGWFEQFAHGPIEGECWEYDKNSAYPDIMSRLPCLLHGSWEHVEEPVQGRHLRNAERDRLGKNGLAFVRAAIEGKHTVVGAMLHRVPQGKVLRPQITGGWYVAAELGAAIEACFVDKVRLYETWKYHPCDCLPPLRELRVLYEDRLKVGKNTIPGKARKLVYNSVAGKFQQSVGLPRWGNPVYATLITSGCRQAMVEAIATHPKGAHDALYVATDGTCFRTPHSNLHLDEQELGAWTPTRRTGLSLFQPGLYWDDESRKRIAEGKAPIFKSRGLPAKSLAPWIKEIDEAWKRFKTEGWPSQIIPIEFQVVSPKQALQRGDWSLCGTPVGRDASKRVSADPAHKRRARGPGRSRPWPGGKGFTSTPYEGRFGDELRESWEQEYGDHPDGPMIQLIAEVLHDK